MNGKMPVIKDNEGNVVDMDNVLNYLDELRESGITNMYGAAPYVAATFFMSETSARRALVYWMQTFDSRHREESV